MVRATLARRPASGQRPTARRWTAETTSRGHDRQHAQRCRLNGRCSAASRTPGPCGSDLLVPDLDVCLAGHRRLLRNRSRAGSSRPLEGRLDASRSIADRRSGGQRRRRVIGRRPDSALRGVPHSARRPGRRCRDRPRPRRRRQQSRSGRFRAWHSLARAHDESAAMAASPLADAWSLAACLRASPDDLAGALRARRPCSCGPHPLVTWCSRFMTPVFQSDARRRRLGEGRARSGRSGGPWVRRQFVTTFMGVRTSPDVLRGGTDP